MIGFPDFGFNLPKYEFKLLTVFSHNQVFKKEAAVQWQITPFKILLDKGSKLLLEKYSSSRLQYCRNHACARYLSVLHLSRKAVFQLTVMAMILPTWCLLPYFAPHAQGALLSPEVAAFLQIGKWVSLRSTQWVSTVSPDYLTKVTWAFNSKQTSGI